VIFFTKCDKIDKKYKNCRENELWYAEFLAIGKEDRSGKRGYQHRRCDYEVSNVHRTLCESRKLTKGGKHRKNTEYKSRNHCEYRNFSDYYRHSRENNDTRKEAERVVVIYISPALCAPGFSEAVMKSVYRYPRKNGNDK
jgi:hypothetical protein